METLQAIWQILSEIQHLTFEYFFNVTSILSSCSTKCQYYMQNITEIHQVKKAQLYFETLIFVQSIGHVEEYC